MLVSGGISDLSFVDMILFFIQTFWVYFTNCSYLYIFQLDRQGIYIRWSNRVSEVTPNASSGLNYCFLYLNLHGPTWGQLLAQIEIVESVPQIMWMTTGMAPMMFPGAHQFMPPMAVGMNSACMPAAQGLSHMSRLPYMNHSMPNHIPLNSSPAMNPINVANQMQNIQLREASNPFLHPDGWQTVPPQVQKYHTDKGNFQASLIVHLD